MLHASQSRRLVAAIGLLVALVAGACGSSSPTTQDPDGGNAGVVEDTTGAQTGGSIVYGLEAESDGWNPANSKWAASGLMVARAVFDTLTAYDADLNVQPFLAESLTPNADYTQWTITLRPNIKLHNGRPIDAEVVKANFEYLKSSVLTSAAFDPIDSFATAGPLDVRREHEPAVGELSVLTRDSDRRGCRP